ncbi:hypothetical protein ACFQ8O_10175 [Streptomyces coelicoflavus]|uniref:hypothetical protein n=1 Tax=Streptomyces coelicoflavus TaxID=285562 RepID=UPI0036CCA86A
MLGGGFMLCLAPSLCGVSPVHFGLLAHLGIAQAEAQLAELAAQVVGVRFVERGGLLRPLSIAPMKYGTGCESATS